MKKIIILTIATLALFAAGAYAADPNDRKITTDNQSIEQRDDTVFVEFDVVIGKRVARSGHTVVYRPYLANGEYRWDLPEVVVRDTRAGIAEQRHEWVTGETIVFEDPVVVRGGDSFRYSTSVPRQGWMNGANLEVEIIDMGCCSIDTQTSGLLAENIDLPTPVAVIEAGNEPPVEIIPEPAPVTTGDLIAKEMPFVLHASEFESTMPSLMFDDDREGALKVHFAVSSSRLDPKRGNNAETLRLLLEALERLDAAPDSHVEHVVVAGFASPEGSFQFNDRLAWNRASVLKKYIVQHSKLDDETVHIYNGVEDWYGLRLMVEQSGMANKAEVIDIIDNVPIADANGRPAREQALRRLDGGRTYSYMLRNFFPELRKAAYIKIYYGNNEETNE